MVLLLSAADVAALLDLDALVDALESAMIDLSRGDASLPLRVGATVADRSASLFAMPSFVPSAGALTAKVVTQFPANRDRPAHQALVCCFDADNGTPLAVLDGTYLTNARTAAGSVLATRLLARADARVVAVIGTGALARAHVRAFSRPPYEVVVAGRDASRAAQLAGELGAGAAESIEDAVRGADIVCAATHADRPVLSRQWLRAGTHVNSAGYNAQGVGEVDTATVLEALVAVESRASALADPPSGAVELRDLAPDQVVELGELAAGRSPGRAGDEQLTLYKSVGVGVEDAAAAALVLRAAVAGGRGTDVPF